MRVIFLWITCLGLVACQHDTWTLNTAARSQPAASDRVIPTCMTFLAGIEAMSPKELKAENDRWAKVSSEKKADDDIRGALVAGMYQAKSRNYPKAVELLSPLGNKKSLDEGCRTSIRLYSDALTDLAQSDRDLVLERKQKGELERKLKALSDIEKDISQRDSKGHGL
jgi:hypothetical protein